VKENSKNKGSVSLIFNFLKIAAYVALENEIVLVLLNFPPIENEV